MSTLPAGGSAFGSISSAPGREDQYQLDKTNSTKATAVSASATVAGCNTAMWNVRRADRVPSSNVANKTGRVRRVDA
jgi:hypothetical protein